MKTPIRISFQGNYEAAPGDHFWRPSTFVIPGLTRNPGFLSGFPLSREWQPWFRQIFMQRLGLLWPAEEVRMDFNNVTIIYLSLPSWGVSLSFARNLLATSFKPIFSRVSRVCIPVWGGTCRILLGALGSCDSCFRSSMTRPKRSNKLPFDFAITKGQAREGILWSSLLWRVHPEADRQGQIWNGNRRKSEAKTVTKNVTILTENIPKYAKLFQCGLLTARNLTT